MCSTRSRPKVAFVDDDARLLNALKRSFSASRLDWDMTFETDPHAALLASQESEPDVLVCDMRMPGMDGVELIRKLRSAGGGSTAIMLTGSDELAVATAAINDGGVFRFFTKPCATEVLLEGIRDALAERARQGAHGGYSELSSLRLADDYDVFDVLAVGVMVLGENARLIYANDVVSEYLNGQEVIRRTADGQVRVAGKGAAFDLAEMVNSVLLCGETRQLGVARSVGRHPLTLTLKKMKTQNSVVVLLSDPERIGVPSTESIAHVLKLSRSEAGLVHELAKGASVSEAAVECGLSVQSARTYLKRIYHKTQTNRQSDLMRLVYSVFPGHIEVINAQSE